MKNIRFFLLFFSLTIFTQAGFAQCLSGNCQNGVGTFKFTSGAKYTGEFYNGKPHGKGMMKFSNENTYDGSWKDGTRDGFGIMTTKNGNRYEGEFKRNVMQGKGTMRYQNGDSYTGKWENDSPNGKGVYQFKTKERYDGEFKDGKFQGQGTMYYPDGARFTGTWKDNRKNGKGKLTEANGKAQQGVWVNGELSKETSNADVAAAPEKTTLNQPSVEGMRNCGKVNCGNGKGYFDYPDGSRYIGEFKAGYPEGKGTCYYANGDVYEGGWSKIAPQGEGIMNFASGRVYGAQWMNGSPVKELDADEVMPETDELVNIEASKKVKVWALVVGVGRYSHMPTLRFTDDDAYQVYSFLRSVEGGGIPENQIRILIDEDATRDNILRTMKSLFGKADANDVVMMYFSGHGLEGCFLPVDFDGYNNKLRHEDILKIFKESKAKHKICIADACHSGTLNGTLAAKGPVTVSLNKYYNAFEKASGGTALLMSSKGEELSLEDQGLRQGVFSHYLLKGLRGLADSNGDTIITIRELYKYVYVKVREYTGNAQTPILTGTFDDLMPVAVRR